MSFLTLTSTACLHSKRIGFVTRCYNVYSKNCKRFGINTVNHPSAQNMDNIKLLLDVSLIKNILPRFKTCEVFVRSPNELRGIVFITFVRGYSISLLEFQIIQRRVMGQLSNELYRIWKEVVVI
jgi:hypothetical protein